MNIKANMKADIEAANQKKTTIATGWVEIEGLLKFPVSVRTYKDETTGKDMMFVSYPQRKDGDKYYGVVYPHDKATRLEIDKVVLEATKEKLFAQSVPDVKIDDIRITVTNKKTDAPIQNVGIASVKMYGLTINGIMIKEGNNGLFIKMPQYLSDGQYHDTVYGLTSAIKNKIATRVIDAYNSLNYNEKKEEPAINQLQHMGEAQKLTPEMHKSMQEYRKEPLDEEQLIYTPDEAIRVMSTVFELNNNDSVRFIIQNTNTKVDKTAMNGDYIRAQSFLIQEGNGKIFGIFQNEYNGNNIIGEGIPIRQQILMQVFRDNIPEQPYVYATYNADNLTDAGVNYKKCIKQWADLTHQDPEKLLNLSKNKQKEKQISHKL